MTPAGKSAAHGVVRPPDRHTMKQFLSVLASVIAGEAVLRAVNVAATIYIGRSYGGAVLGAYAACLAVVTATTMLMESGLQTFAITTLSVLSSTRDEIAGRLYAMKCILTASTVLFIAVGAVIAKLNAFLWMLGSVVAIRIILQSHSQMHIAFLKALQKARVIGTLQLLHALFLISGFLLAAKYTWTMVPFLSWFVAGQLFESYLTWRAFHRAGLRLQIPASLRFWHVVRQSFPFGVATGLSNLIVRLDVIVLSWLVPLSVLGTFSAANSMLLVVYLAAWLFGSLLLPEMIQLSAKRPNLEHYVRLWSRWTWTCTVPLTALSYFSAPAVISFFFGPAFRQSSRQASIMLLAVPFILMNAVCTNFLIASQKQATIVVVYVMTVAVTVGLNLLAGRQFGPIGVATAIVVREAGLFSALRLFALRRVFTTKEMEFKAAC